MMATRWFTKTGLILALCFCINGVGHGQYSDYYSNRQSADRSGSMTYRYGGTHSDAARDWYTQRYGYPSAPAFNEQGRRSPQPLSEHDRRLFEESRARANSILQHHYGPQANPTPWASENRPDGPTQLTPEQQRAINDSQRLIDDIYRGMGW